MLKVNMDGPNKGNPQLVRARLAGTYVKIFYQTKSHGESKSRKWNNKYRSIESRHHAADIASIKDDREILNWLIPIWVDRGIQGREVQMNNV